MQFPIMNRPLSLENLQEVLAVISQYAPTGSSTSPGIAFGDDQSSGFYLDPNGGLFAALDGQPAWSLSAPGQMVLSSPSAIPQQITLRNTSGTSQRAAIVFGDSSWALLRDQSGNGGNDLALYNGATNHTPARWTQDEQLFITWEPTTVLTANAYNKTGSPVVINNGPGNSKPTIGTSIGLQVGTVVGDVDDLADNTRSEFGTYYGVTIADPRRTQGRINLWGPDIHVFGKFTDDATQREGFCVGYSAFLRPVAAGSSTKDADHAGVYGACIVFNPPEAGVLSEYGVSASKRSYPAVAGVSICGWSGTNSITSGDQAGADYAAEFGLRIGGEQTGGGSGYINWNARSKFAVGAVVSDFDTKGIWITNPLPAASGASQWGLYNECPTYLSGVVNAQSGELGFFGAAPVAQQGMWPVQSTGALADAITAINQITANLVNLGLFKIST